MPAGEIEKQADNAWNFTFPTDFGGYWKGAVVFRPGLLSVTPNYWIQRSKKLPGPRREGQELCGRATTAHGHWCGDHWCAAMPGWRLRLPRGRSKEDPLEVWLRMNLHAYLQAAGGDREASRACL